jgi:hypothetical protein
MKLTPNHRRFHLERDVDISGVSGTGDRIAEGCVFTNGVVVLEWLSPCASTNRYASIDTMLQVHGHGGATRIVWDDPETLDSGRK